MDKDFGKKIEEIIDTTRQDLLIDLERRLQKLKVQLKEIGLEEDYKVAKSLEKKRENLKIIVEKMTTELMKEKQKVKELERRELQMRKLQNNQKEHITDTTNEDSFKKEYECLWYNDLNEPDYIYLQRKRYGLE